MPLSRARDKARKKRERAKSRLEKLLCPPQTSKPVQPRQPLWSVSPDEGVKFRSIMSLEYDADGNPMPDYT